MPLAYLGPLLLSACLGLAAGPPAETSATVPVPRDSVWARARRAYQAEGLTVDVADSLHGQLTGLRYPSASARPGSQETCRVQVALRLAPAAQGTQLAWTSRWAAPEKLAQRNSALCEEERTAVLTRIQQTITPTP
jgi:hypothetical protein